jgi:NADH:ubiquinone reductase (H+-translocating)
MHPCSPWTRDSRDWPKVADVVILGGGFAGIYTARELDRHQAAGIETALISEDNFFLFTPMLSEIVASSIDTRHVVNPIRRMFRHIRFMEARVNGVDFQRREVKVLLPTGVEHPVAYDHLVIALGSVINYFGLPGVEEHSLPLKTLADAIVLRNRAIQRLEEADILPERERAPYLTFVVAGGNLSGVELAGELNDFLRSALDAYSHIRQAEVRLVLAEARDRLMSELSPSLANFTRRKLTERGVEVRLNAPVIEASEAEIVLGGATDNDRTVIATRNLIWTAGVAPTPSVEAFGIPLSKGRIEVDQAMRVPNHHNVWALGDVALIPDGRGSFQPQTAQHAVREGRLLARNIVRSISGRRPRPFRYHTMGMLATIGHRSGAGEIFGLKISGFPAWLAWRTYYLMRLPRFDKRLRVMLDWTLDLFFPRDIVQLKIALPGVETEGKENAGEERT